MAGSGRPAPSEMQLTMTGTEMTTEEHVVTAETHLRYAEGHLQPSEEHLADAEVHLKLVKAHLAVLGPAEQTEVNFLETVSPPTPRIPTKEIGAVPAAPRKMPMRRAKMASAAEKENSSGGPEMVFVQRREPPRRGPRRRSPPRQRTSGCVPSTTAGNRQPTPWTVARGSRVCRSPRGGGCLRNGAVASAASWTAETERRERDAIGELDFGDTIC